jgi:hypothetical protein
MGVEGLLPELKPYLQHVSLTSMWEKVVGLDVSTLVHVLLLQHCEELLEATPMWDSFLRAFRRTIECLLGTKCTLIAVLDGRRVSVKLVNVSRAQEREKARRSSPRCSLPSRVFGHMSVSWQHP